MLSPTTESELDKLGLMRTNLVTTIFLTSVPSVALSITTVLIVIFVTWAQNLKITEIQEFGICAGHE